MKAQLSWMAAAALIALPVSAAAQDGRFHVGVGVSAGGSSGVHGGFHASAGDHRSRFGVGIGVRGSGGGGRVYVGGGTRRGFAVGGSFRSDDRFRDRDGVRFRGSYGYPAYGYGFAYGGYPYGYAYDYAPGYGYPDTYAYDDSGYAGDVVYQSRFRGAYDADPGYASYDDNQVYDDSQRGEDYDDDWSAGAPPADCGAWRWRRGDYRWRWVSQPCQGD
jgi:hypothetical protein